MAKSIKESVMEARRQSDEDEIIRQAGGAPPEEFRSANSANPLAVAGPNAPKPPAAEPPKRLATLKVKLDKADHEAVLSAIALRRSGLFRVNGELLVPEGDSDEAGTLLAEICRGWIESLSVGAIQAARQPK